MTRYRLQSYLTLLIAHHVERIQKKNNYYKLLVSYLHFNNHLDIVIQMCEVRKNSLRIIGLSVSNCWDLVFFVRLCSKYLCFFPLLWCWMSLFFFKLKDNRVDDILCFFFLFVYASLDLLGVMNDFMKFGSWFYKDTYTNNKQLSKVLVMFSSSLIFFFWYCFFLKRKDWNFKHWLQN